MVFYEGPLTAVPLDEPACDYGRTGWLGCAFSQARRLAVTNIIAIALIASTTALMGALFFATSPTEGVVAKTIFVVLGVWVGLAVGLAIISVWELLPWSRRHHWVPNFTAGFNGYPFVALKSLHWHTVMNLRMEIKTPSGTVISSDPAGAARWPVFVTRPGDQLLPLSLDPMVGGNFEPGVYRFRWLMNAPNRERPVVVANAKHRFVQ